MARVPISEGNRVALAPLPSQRIQPVDVSAGMRAIGEGLQSLGNAGADFAQAQVEMEGRHDQAAVKEAANAVSRHYAEIGYTGPNAYYHKQGKEALSLRPTIESSLDSLIDQSRKALKTQRQQEMFDSAIVPQRIQWGVQVANHADKETRTYDLEESTARVGVVGELARAAYLDDPAHGEAQIGTGLREIENVGRLQGWGPEKTALEKLKFTSGTYRDIGSSLVTTDGANGPMVAREFVEKHQDSMNADDRRFILDRATVQDNHLEALARRDEAEGRRLAREARSDAKDRARSAAENIDLGIPLSTEEFASAVADARTSEDAALLQRLEVGQFKNSLTVEYNDTPPADIQERVNALDADIAKAGGKVKPETVIERDHLQSLLNKTNAELKSDPLSWGARHLGLNPGKLVMRDPASIDARIRVAQRVSEATGAAPQPFTTEEAAALAPTLVNGSVEDKVRLATRVARFGPLSGHAARQIAPSDPGFQNLVGLAGHANAGVAASRVNQVVAGTEILKTKSKLIDNTAAFRMLNEHVGGALMFLPSVKSGVFENAKALLASESNERGYSEWNEANPRWFAAVNSALGAYSRGGVQHGGLAQFNNAVTVVPEDMATTDFESRIARAKAPQIVAAHNGTPRYRGGETPTATEIKKMQWVPVSDGVYRLTPDGRDFIRTTTGAFYQIDVRKLR